MMRGCFFSWGLMSSEAMQGERNDLEIELKRHPLVFSGDG